VNERICLQERIIELERGYWLDVRPVARFQSIVALTWKFQD